MRRPEQAFEHLMCANTKQLRRCLIVTTFERRRVSHEDGVERDVLWSELHLQIVQGESVHVQDLVVVASVLAHLIVQPSETSRSERVRGVVDPGGFLEDGHSPVEQRLDIVEPVHTLFDRRKGGEGFGDDGVMCPHRPLLHHEDFLKLLFGIIKRHLFGVHSPDVESRGGTLDVRSTDGPLLLQQRGAVQSLRLVVPLLCFFEECRPI
mmetsp:Transcript_16952/g.36731  ORF Transcript_16952/g.36731 Transcript_16952/m.36731 type:complete len:208 (+) Transcript_16952:647-1270(+)